MSAVYCVYAGSLLGPEQSQAVGTKGDRVRVPPEIIYMDLSGEMRDRCESPGRHAGRSCDDVYCEVVCRLGLHWIPLSAGCDS